MTIPSPPQPDAPEPPPATSPPTKVPRTKSLRIACYIIISMAALAVIISLIARRIPYPVWHINDTVSISYLQTLTHGTEEIRILPLYVRMKRHIPQFIQNALHPLGFQFPPNVLGYYVQPGQTVLVLQVKTPPDWYTRTVDLQPDKAEYLHDLLQNYSYGIVSNKHYRGKLQTNHLQPTVWGTKTYDPPNYATTLIFAAIHNQINPADKYLTLEIYDHSAPSTPDGDPPVAYSIDVPNPYYTHESPATLTAQTLPASQTHGNVTVTIHAVHSKASDHTRPAIPDLPQRANNTIHDPSLTTIDLSINTAGTALSDWKPKKIESFYTTTKQSYPFVSHSSINNNSTSDTSRYRVYLSNDIAALRQPVRISVSLHRDRNFPPDEIQTIKLPLPGQGHTHIIEAPPLSFWNGAVNVREIAHTSTFNAPSYYQFSPPAENADFLALAFLSEISESSLRNIIADVTLLGTTSTAKLTDHYKAGNYATMSEIGQSRTELRFDRLRQNADPTFTLSDYTTLSLTLARPRDFPHTFEFIVEPTEIPE